MHNCFMINSRQSSCVSGCCHVESVEIPANCRVFVSAKVGRDESKQDAGCRQDPLGYPVDYLSADLGNHTRSPVRFFANASAIVSSVWKSSALRAPACRNKLPKAGPADPISSDRPIK